MNCIDMAKLRQFYLDRELDPTDMAAVGIHLRDCPACRGADARERALSAAITEDLPHYRAPAALRERILRDLDVANDRPLTELRYLARGWNPIAIAASLLFTIATSTALTSTYLAPSAEDHVVSEVVSSHVRSLMAEHLTDVAASDRHTVKPWFTGKVDAAPPAVDLAAAGFPLIGGRLDYVDERPCAALVYRHDKHIINVLVWAAKDSTLKRPDFYERQGFNLAHFEEGAMDFWAISDIDKAELKDFADRLIQSTQESGTYS
jgi:anti-sigma factor RsiW